jgi:hypothetical protein
VSGRKEARQLKAQLESEGFLVLYTGSGHYEVRAEGRKVTTFTSTPSDHRWKCNALAHVKRWKREREAPATGQA